jgi:hypothetical protein
MSIKDLHCRPTAGGRQRRADQQLQDDSICGGLPFNGAAATTRRSLLGRIACGFGSVALAGVCADSKSDVRADDSLPVNPRFQQSPILPQRAKRVIFLFMQGGPSHIDSYDRKPLLEKNDGQTVDFKVARTREVTPMPLMASPWRFSKHGECGREVSELFPHMAQHVDDYCVIKSMHTEGVAHGPATLFLHTGATNLVRPSVGSWVTYGLGTENNNLPGFITICPSAANGGPRNYANGFLPTAYQGTTLGAAERPVVQAKFRHITNTHLSPTEQRKRFNFLQQLNQKQLDTRNSGRDFELEATLNSFELAWRMQSHAPGVVNMSAETSDTKSMYGINEKTTEEFGRQCLMARQFAEAGVRYIQVNYADNGSNPRWDQHSNLMKHEQHARAIDKPVAGLLADLKQRGLLEDTLVWWGGEFGRTPYAQNRDGRDHNPGGFTVWLAGGGIKPGIEYGATDEYGFYAIQDKVHMHDLHATILHQMGLDHEQLTYRHAGRDFRLTDVNGRIVKDILA